MLKKILVIISILSISLFAVSTYFLLSSADNTEVFLSPRSNNTVFIEEKATDTVFKDKEILNVLLLGTDTSSIRRNRGQTGFNTDTMILVSVNTKTNRVLLTSAPRDLWINGNKINALYTVYGYETLKSSFETITGQKIDGYIRADFDALKWIADAFGGIPVNVKKTFTDTNFPNYNDTEIITVVFAEGREIMSGDRALAFARSRKGDNGEGSDLMRAKRQHLILQGMIEGISQIQSQFWPMDIPKFYEAVTQHMHTTLSLSDIYYLWDFYKDKDKYSIESFVIDSNYVYHPGLYPQSEYHSWVFIPRAGALSKLHQDITAKLNGTFEVPAVAGDSQSEQAETYRID